MIDIIIDIVNKVNLNYNYFVNNIFKYCKWSTKGLLIDGYMRTYSIYHCVFQLRQSYYDQMYPINRKQNDIVIILRHNDHLF